MLVHSTDGIVVSAPLKNPIVENAISRVGFLKWLAADVRKLHKRLAQHQTLGGVHHVYAAIKAVAREGNAIDCGVVTKQRKREIAFPVRRAVA